MTNINLVTAADMAEPRYRVVTVPANNKYGFVRRIVEYKPNTAPTVTNAGGSVRCPHCHWGFAPEVIDQHIREKH